MSTHRHRIPPALLRRLRNEVAIAQLITIGLDLPHKHSEGYLRFLCPRCGEFNTAVNPRTNLGRCFRCRENFNPIDLVLAVRECSFLEAVDYLRELHSPAK
jgi:predicted RNA-binding Zn-ribbon protein involved in translation (DUF1610 family)